MPTTTTTTESAAGGVNGLHSPPLPCPIAPDAERFLATHRLHDELRTAIEAVRSEFDLESMSVDLREDPESDDAWLVLRIQVHGTVESTVEAVHRYTAVWVKSIPWQRRFMIRLSFHILD